MSGAQPPRPAISFAHFCFDEALVGAVRKSEYTQPTAIQSQVSTIRFVKASLIIYHVQGTNLTTFAGMEISEY